MNEYRTALAMTDQNKIDRSTFRQGQTLGICELHITGGARAIEQDGRLWSWQPVISGGMTQELAPLSIERIGLLASQVGLDLFGVDQQSGLDTPLISRFWTPLAACRT